MLWSGSGPQLRLTWRTGIRLYEEVQEGTGTGPDNLDCTRHTIPGDSGTEQGLESQAHVPLNSRDLREEGVHDRFGIAERAKVELWRSQLQRTQHRIDEARARRSPLGLPVDERKETG